MSPELPKPFIQMPDMCEQHRVMLITEAGYYPQDPWRALIVVAQIALFQAVTADPRTHVATGGKIERVTELGCFACRKPDAFGEVVEAAKTHDFGVVKALGERWVKEAARAVPDEQC